MVANHLSSNGTPLPLLRSAEFRRIILTTHKFKRGVWVWDGNARPSRCAIVFQTSGSLQVTTYSQDGRAEIRSRACQAIILQGGNRTHLEFSGMEAGCNIIWIPENMIASFGVAKDRPIIIADNVIVSGAGAFLKATLEAQRYDPCHSNLSVAMENMLLGIYVGLVVQSNLQKRPESHAYSQFDAARNLILTQAGDPNFTPEKLANQINISTRQLQRIFARFGLTPSAMIRSHRTDLARTLLKEKSNTGITIAEIANRVGFSSPAAMRRALRQENEHNTTQNLEKYA